MRSLKSEPKLTSPRLVLRPGKPEDVPAIVGFYRRNRRHLAPWSPVYPAGFFTRPFWRQRLEAYAREWEAGHALRFFLFLRDTPDRVIGTISFTQIFRGPFQNAYLGYSLDEKEQGQGLMTEGVKAAVGWAFQKLLLHRISANHVPENVRSREVLRRLGFVVEGYARDYLLINGVWKDHVLNSLTNSDWKATT